METVSVNVFTLCVPCACRCRYCLLSYDGKTAGAEYERSRAYAERFRLWLRENRPNVGFQFYFGCSMEHPELFAAIGHLQKMGCAGGEFLQLNGLKMRSEAETALFIESIRNRGIKSVDLTFYGTEQYHDRFAARAGDFKYLAAMLEKAVGAGLEATVSIPVNRENVCQIDELIGALEQYRPARIRLFVPHGEGRGKSLEPVRFRERDYISLSPRAKALFNRGLFRPEKEWLHKEYSPKKRMVAISLTVDNIQSFESMSFSEAIRMAEKLDDDYYSQVPGFSELAKRYGDPAGENMYSQRDLYMLYQRRYIEETGLQVYDVNDERQCFIRRF